ncbi:MAG: dTDP-4-dehydrorhamnose reductase [Bacteroidales bacterium]|jgi:dTDP-4-dehydrorhamnose reductase|nr:dTDP-4-dehydrorhamnose reductase [Bacteroidales bacterium]
MNKQIVLVTGANGQLGRCIQKLSVQYEQYNFIFTDIEQLDITSLQNIEEFLAANKVEIIVNAAAYTAVDKAETDYEKADLVNNVAVQNLVKAIHQTDIKLIHISTDYVFNGDKNTPYSHNDATDPQSVYGLTKLKGENAALQHSNTLIIRTSWLYSEYGTNFVKTMLRLGQEKESLNVVFDQTGTPTYAMDLAEFILNGINKTHGQMIVNYSNEGVCSWYDFARKIMQMANLNCKVLPILSSLYPSIAKRPNYSVLDKTNTKSIFDIDIPHWEDSLSKCIDNITKC